MHVFVLPHRSPFAFYFRVDRLRIKHAMSNLTRHFFRDSVHWLLSDPGAFPGSQDP